MIVYLYFEPVNLLFYFIINLLFTPIKELIKKLETFYVVIMLIEQLDLNLMIRIDELCYNIISIDVLNYANIHEFIVLKKFTCFLSFFFNYR